MCQNVDYSFNLGILVDAIVELFAVMTKYFKSYQTIEVTSMQ